MSENKNALIISLNKGIRMDLTAQMKDVDEIFAAFKQYQIQFEKKYTSLITDGPSTITFRGIKTEGPTVRISDLLEDLHGRAKQNIIGNVYLYFTPAFPSKKKALHDTTAISKEEETESEDSTL